MNRLFGKKSKEPKPTLEDASSRIGARSEAVDSRLAKLDAELMKLKQQIQHSSGMTQQRLKQRAVQILQQKRQYQSQQDGIMKQQFNIDQLQFTTETMKDTKIQIAALKDANKTLKKELKKINIDKVENMQDDLADLYVESQEIQEIMGRAYEVPDEVDEDEMLGELEALDFDTVKESEADYLSDALAMPTQKLPEKVPATGNNPVDNDKQETKTDPYSLEAQLGL
ncbi:unnamed protein product [Phytomonas sp. EM1]|nr:unnamed protein product [Phytomonas sp. EM1]|eukprot:CCW64753.1 unnamed protein product [Phytomonas sp. isolate EM1]